MTISTPRLHGTQGYGENAESLATQYESLTFAEVHRDTLHLFPRSPALIADIGAGSGRDAAALAGMGHRVLAIEPTPELRAEGQRLHGGKAIEWIDDGLPFLAKVRSAGIRADLILLTAVWMHLDAEERGIAMESLQRLLAPAGTIVMSLRHGPVPEGRRMFDVSYSETADLAQRHGLRPLFSQEREDMLGRGDVRWTFLALAAQ
jgi:SAM-dependent methyltransferase